MIYSDGKSTNNSSQYWVALLQLFSTEGDSAPLHRLSMCGNDFGSHTRSHKWHLVGERDAVKHPTASKTALTKNNRATQRVNSTGVQKPCATKRPDYDRSIINIL